MWLRLDGRLSCRLLGRFLDFGIVIGRARVAAAMLMCATVLFHVVLARESLVAFRAERVLFPSMLLRVTCGVARSGEEVGAADLLGHWTWILVLLVWRLAAALLCGSA